MFFIDMSEEEALDALKVDLEEHYSNLVPSLSHCRLAELGLF